MAISSAQVFAAADTIATTGKTPTAAAVRALLGTGSFLTITPILREWIDAQVPHIFVVNSAESVPQQFIDCLLTFVPQLWKVATNIADEHLLAFRTERDAERISILSAIADRIAAVKLISADLKAAQAQIAELQAKLADLKELGINSKLSTSN